MTDPRPRRAADDPARHARPAMNMTPMIDVTFQLIVVFLCSLKFKTLDMKLETRLPDQGPSARPQAEDLRPRAEVRLRRRGAGEPVRISVMGTALGTDDEGPVVWTRVEAALAAARARGADVLAEIDADGDVPHGVVVRAVDSAVAAGVLEVRFRGTRTGP